MFLRHGAVESASDQNCACFRIFFQLSVSGTFWSGELKQETGVEPPEYLQRVSLTSDGRYRYRECGKELK